MDLKAVLLALCIVLAVSIVVAPAAEARGPGGSCTLKWRDADVRDDAGVLPIIQTPYFDCTY